MTPTPNRPPARRPPPPPPTRRPLSAEAQADDRRSNDEFERQAQAFRKATHQRPAVVSEPEVNAMRTRYTTGSGRLDALRKLAGARYAFYVASQGGTPDRTLTPFETDDAGTFFDVYGMDRLAPTAETPVASVPPDTHVEPAPQPETPAEPHKGAFLTSSGEKPLAISGAYAEVNFRYLDYSGRVVLVPGLSVDEVNDLTARVVQVVGRLHMTWGASVPPDRGSHDTPDVG